MKRVLDRDEPLYGKGDYQPHAEEAADAAEVDKALTPAVLVEHLVTSTNMKQLNNCAMSIIMTNLIREVL